MRSLIASCVVAAVGVLLVAQAPPVPARYKPSVEERAAIQKKTVELRAALAPLRNRTPDDVFIDADVYLKAAEWVQEFDEFYAKADVEHALAVLDTGLDRARQLRDGNPTWTKKTGVVSRAYLSRVDHSIQPYAVTVPENYSGNTPQWLEVVLHGRGATLTEMSFLYAHDRAKPEPSDHQFIRLEVFGRGNNAYRWAGETDVFEAIESVKNRYKIDPDRIALRGFSMGGAGAWHLGLHHPDKWAVVEAGAGFVETKVHGNVPEPPPYTHIYDALDYAANAVNVPIVGYGGEDDPQLRASVFVRNELDREGYGFEQKPYEYTAKDIAAVFLMGPKTQHRWEPESKKKSDAFVLQHLSEGILERSKGRFVTYTEKYNRAFRVTVDQLEQQYRRAEIDWDVSESDLRVKTMNVARLTLRGERPIAKFVVDGQSFPMGSSASFERVEGKWAVAKKSSALRKQHNLQGPIDDAFMEPFVCVRPLDRVNDYAATVFERFEREFPKWMRGRLLATRSLRPGDSRAYNIVVFGTPATNPMVARALKATPLQWTSDEIVVGAQRFDSKTHLLSFIYPNPDYPGRYVVVNSGHTFHEADFTGTNALLYPRAGDWAVTDVRSGAIVAEGVFDKNWQLPKR